jgi:hypothetical protein
LNVRRPSWRGPEKGQVQYFKADEAAALGARLVQRDGRPSHFVIEAVRHFADRDACQAYMVSVKWPDGKITCPKCGGEKIGFISTRQLYRCNVKGCRKQFSCKVGTIFEDSPLGLDKWFVAVWQIANCKNGISRLELHRALGITQKTAWFILHRIRLAMRTGTFRKMDGVTLKKVQETRA